MTRRRFIFAGLAWTSLVAWLGMTQALAYPEYRAYVVKNSGRPVNCALCHAHSDGPEGAAPGQIGSLNPEQLARLGQARAAFEPGQEVNSPILNAFGNALIKRVGKRQFLELRSRPAELSKLLDPKSDLDQDGIPDVREFLEGTHPLNPNDGNPRILFTVNFQRNLVHIVLMALATLAGLYGLIHFLRGFAQASRVKGVEDGEPSEFR